MVASIVCVAQARPTAAQIDQRAESLLKQMTLEEKIVYIGGYNNFYIRAIPRLGIPELKMADGPAGVRNYGPATAFPTGIAMAASWDTALIERVGTMMGKDARARGVHFLLAPGMNIYRAPMCGRNFEYFGEDPFLASRIAVADIAGIQSQSVIATAKHYAANNEEWDRHRVSSEVDERTLREIYLPAFEASVKDGHAGAIMDSYNLVNGVHATQNSHLNTEIAKHEWGFRGIIMSDWDATYDGIAAANGGLDLEMPSGKFMNAATLLPAVHSGRVSESVIGDKLRRILRTAIAFGFFDHPQTDNSIPLDNPEAHTVALEAARGSIVLLKNNGILPLDPSKLKSVALIGPNAEAAAWGGGGSGLVQPFHAISPLEGVHKYLGTSVKVDYSPGVLLMSQVFRDSKFTTTADGATPGLSAEYFNNKDLAGTPAVTRTDAHIAFDWGQGSYTSQGPADNFSARWIGYFTPLESGSYSFAVSGDDGFRLYVDDHLVIDQWIYQGETLIEKKLDLKAGLHYKVRLEYFEGDGDAKIGFGITHGGNHALDVARALASRSDAVVLCVGFSAMTEGEGFDRPFELPQDQQVLIKSILAANKNVIVVINAGGNVDMSQWIDAPSAVLYAWYPGQEGGTALAETLFGKINPSGKLPISLERRWEDNATFNSYYDNNGSKHVAYSEGVFLGYRHFDKTGTKPLFPFGYGLSYTRFEYSGLTITPASVKQGTEVTVTYTVKNVGSLRGAEVSEVYVGDQHSRVPRPVKELKGFAKTTLQPGESKLVSVSLDARAFSYYDVSKHAWTIDPGKFDILVGASSQNINLRGSVTITQ
ncbi:MAG: glycoside hydrolase, family 3-like protein [Candidatus Angelobacter sp.]|nr:glycoside hydrolase, family 3-like protein [Candidatus Angelobacter sp.]